MVPQLRKKSGKNKFKFICEWNHKFSFSSIFSVFKLFKFFDVNDVNRILFPWYHKENFQLMFIVLFGCRVWP